MSFLFVFVYSIYAKHQTKTKHRKHKTDPDLNVGDLKPLLDSSAQKHKLAVKPRKKHASSHRSLKKYSPKPGER
jgi:hypothetical protein